MDAKNQPDPAPITLYAANKSWIFRAENEENRLLNVFFLIDFAEVLCMNAAPLPHHIPLPRSIFFIKKNNDEEIKGLVHFFRYHEQLSIVKKMDF